MKHGEIMMSQIDAIRQARNNDPNSYPRTIETLWVLMKNQRARKQVEEKKKELGLESSFRFISGPFVKPFDMDAWDAIFQYTIATMDQFGELNE